MVAALCLCTQLSPDSLKMISFGNNNGNPPSAPVIKSAVAGVGSVTVSWDSVNGAQSYNLYYEAGATTDTVQGIKMPGVTSPKQVTGLTNGTQYAFAVCAVNAAGESALSNIMTATPAIAPSITLQPQSKSVTVGQSVTFSVVASGTSPLDYQWKKNDSIIPGATADSLSIPSAQNSNAGAYTVVVSNASGSAVSDAATLTVTAAPVAPGIATQPKSQTVMAGSSVTLTVSATGTGPLTYKWEKNGDTIANSNSSSYTIANVTNADAGTYCVIVTNSVANVTSLDAVLTVTATPVVPTITTQPQSQTVIAGQTVTFTVTATGTGPLSYQWQKGNSAISGAMASSYSITNVQNSNAGAYSVKVTNSVGAILSDSAVLTVTAAAVAPSINTQPQSQTMTAGQNVTLSVIASGTAPFTYQWKKDNDSISGATSNSLYLPAIQTSNAGTYTVVVSNSAGTAVSNGAVITVNAAPAIPNITTQPRSDTVTAGQSVTFSVVATGTLPLSYLWKKNGTALPGDTTPTFTIATVAVTDSGSYTVTVTNGAGNAVSNAAILKVNPAPVAPTITVQPKSDTVTAGQSVTFSVTATGTVPLAYQWYKNDTAISGATSPSYSILTVQTANAGTYTVKVSNGTLPNATSNGAVLTVNSAPVAPSITPQQQSQTVVVGQTVTFYATATGTPPLSYQWYKNGTIISGATSSTYAISNVQPSDSGTYTFTVSNGIPPNATSNAAVLTVIVPPTIIVQPQADTVMAGQSVTFSVTVTGTPPFSYQWYRYGVAISGATSSTYTITNVSPANAGMYTVTVSNGGLPNANSKSALLTVNYAPIITGQPQSLAVVVGQSIRLSVDAGGSGSLSYQWYKNDTAINGATSSNLDMSNLQLVNAGRYTVKVSNGISPNAISNAAVLTIGPYSVTDIDGNVYQTVAIGTQIWMVQNLKTTKYIDGSSIPFMSGGWFELAAPAYCWYNYDSTYKSTYGALYDWYTVNTGRLAPAGWHVPTDSDWTVLTTYLGGDTIAAGPMKATGTTYWSSPNTGATNVSGFSALPGGYCSDGGDFHNIGYTGSWWSSTPGVASDAWCRLVSNSTTLATRYKANWGFACSVRCILNP